MSTLSTEVIENAAADYALDAGFSLTRFVGVLPLDPPVPASYQINTSTVAESAANSAIVTRPPSSLIAWGMPSFSRRTQR